MYSKTVEHFSQLAAAKTVQMRENPCGFMAGSIAGGAYVGLGILLIFSVGATLPSEVQKLAMGATFALALILVVIAGAELFTGYAMYMVFGLLSKSIGLREAWRPMCVCWLGNLVGAVLVAALFAIGGANGLLNDPQSFLMKVAEAKVSASPLALIARATLCNWLVCLALWMSARVDSDIAKCAVIFWCLLAFIASGFEHSVANMTLLTLAAIGHHGDAFFVAKVGYNLAVVSVGNLLGGGVMVAVLYWLVDERRARSAHDNNSVAVKPKQAPTLLR